MARARISALRIYPIKSCAGIALSEAKVLPTGLEFDRRWMVVNQQMRFQTQRELPRLALVRTQLGADGVHLQAPGMPPLLVPVQDAGRRVMVRVWSDDCTGLDAGEEAAQWFSGFLGQPLRLVGFDTSTRRPCDPDWTDGVPATTQFADGFPFLVLSQASLDDLDSRLARPLPMDRFRPSILIEGIEAYGEDHIHELRAGPVQIRLVKPCMRCVITTTDQAVGERDGEEPLRTLKSYRWNARQRGIAFGQNAILLQGGEQCLRVGQEIEILWA